MSYMSNIQDKRKKALRSVPQTQPLPGREAEMVRNAAGGYVFQATDLQRLNNFIILGTLGGTYYVGEAQHTKENLAVVDRLIAADGVNVVRIATDISTRGLAPKNDHAVFVLARAFAIGDEVTRRAVEQAVPKVCRIATDLFAWIEYVLALKGKGWGAIMRRAVSNWYKYHNNLPLQVTKYLERNNWSHRDVAFCAHLGLLRKDNEASVAVQAALEYVMDGADKYYERHGNEPVEGAEIITGKILINKTSDKKAVIDLINRFRLTHEMIPTELKREAWVWNELVKSMPVNAAMRNLNVMTNNGAIKANGATLQTLAAKFTNAEEIQRSRVHPFSVLKAISNYSMNGDSNKELLAALDKAFYAAFKNVRPIVKSDGTPARIVFIIDVSGSMSSAHLEKSNLTALQMAAATALAGVHSTEIGYATVICVDTAVRGEMKIGRTDSVVNITNQLARFRGGGTALDASLTYLVTNKIEADGIMILTDNESYSRYGNVSSEWEAYKRFMKSKGVAPVLLNAMTTATSGYLTDPKDPDVIMTAGWDASILDAFALKVAREI